MKKPNTLEEFHQRLLEYLSEKDRKKLFKDLEKGNLNNYHFGLGMWIRNNAFHGASQELKRDLHKKGMISINPDGDWERVLLSFKEWYQGVEGWDSIPTSISERYEDDHYSTHIITSYTGEVMFIQRRDKNYNFGGWGPAWEKYFYGNGQILSISEYFMQGYYTANFNEKGKLSSTSFSLDRKEVSEEDFRKIIPDLLIDHPEEPPF